MEEFNLENLLKESMNKTCVYIQTHNYPDADTLCSAQILKNILGKYNIEAKIIYYGDIVKPNLVKMVELFNIKADKIDDRINAELLINVDCQYGEANVYKVYNDNLIVIDHHIDCNRNTSTIRIKNVDNRFKSCTTLIYDKIIKEFVKNKFITEQEISYIYSLVYYGLLTDTNNFTESLGKEDNKIKYFLEQTELLMTSKINYLINENISISDLKVIANSFDNLVIIEDIKAIYVEVQSCDPNVLGVISDMLLSLSDIDIVVAFMNTKVDYKLSIRSDNPQVKANELVNYFTSLIGSGGGHFKKAGGVINIKKFSKLNLNISDYIQIKLHAFVEISLEACD